MDQAAAFCEGITGRLVEVSGDAEMIDEVNPNPRTVSTRTMNNRKGMRTYALRGLFGLALAWAFLTLGFGEMIVPLNPIPEGSSLHTVMEFWAPPFVAIVTASILLAVIVKLKPGFLSVPTQTTSLQLWGALLVTTVIIGIVLPLIILAVTILLVPPRPHPENVQYIPLVFWLTPLVLIALTPAVSILVAWMWIIFRRAATD